MGDGGGTEYADAGRVLQARHATVEQPGAVVEALGLIQAVLSGSDCPQTEGVATEVAGEESQPAEVLAALTLLRHVREEIAGWEPRLITMARQHGVSWAGLAPALGVTSRQAAERRYLRLRPSTTGAATGEQRVQAERAKRAGDRAVAQWARRNSASLRQLAGQVSALDGLTAPAQQHADRVQQALGDDDPAALLSPLTDARVHLKTSHVALADRINSIAEHIEQLRRETLARRDSPLRDQ